MKQVCCIRARTQKDTGHGRDPEISLVKNADPSDSHWVNLNMKDLLFIIPQPLFVNTLRA